MQSLSFDDVLEALGALSEDERKAVIADAMADNGHMLAVPSPGPQTEAYHSLADVLLYGGQAAGGKTFLLLLLALTQHLRSLVMRRRYTDLAAITEEAIKLNGTRDGFNGSPPPKLRTRDNRLIEFGAANHPGDEDNWRGQAHDFLGIDEATQFAENQVRFLMGWVRSTVPGQRCRAVLATNPPSSAVGDWVIGMFRPWLDLTHPNPAKPGELRWFISDESGQDLEVPGPERIQRDGVEFIPKSRTFIPSALSDNPYLAKTGYRATLDSLPEPLRSAVRDGNFMAARPDSDFQVIPTAWIIAAQDRWTAEGWRDWQMTAMAFDPAGGGRDAAVLAFRHRGWYAPLVSERGASTAESTTGVNAIFMNRRDGAPVVLDVGGGYAGAIKARLQDNDIVYHAFNGAGSSMRKALGTGLPFANKRAEAWWLFREALDPEQQGGSIIALPPDPELRADLAAPCILPRVLEVRGEIQIESKEELRKRLGRSPDKGDAVVMCLSEGNIAVSRALNQGQRSKLPPHSVNPHRNPRYAKRNRNMLDTGSSSEQG